MNKNESTSTNDEHANFLIYKAKDGEVRVDVFLQDETLWLTQKAI